MFLCETTAAANHAFAFLLGRIDYERAAAVPYGPREYQLERIRDLLARLGDPQNRLRIVHVAGTKGKGSTSAMVAAALTAAGYRTGLFTSPHLDRLEERFQIDGQPCSPSQLAVLIDKLRPVVEQMDADGQKQEPPEPGPTYFEITTAVALLYFAGRSTINPLPSDSPFSAPAESLDATEPNLPTDFAVLEVGMGGRLDSTNVCQPLVSVITSISLDHTQQLGDTLAKIAAEKAGIIKPGVPVISGVTDDEPRQVITEAARQGGCRLIQVGRDFDFQYHPPQALDQGHRPLQSIGPVIPCGGTVDFESHLPDCVHCTKSIQLSLLGRHQAANAAVALATLDELVAQGWAISEQSVRRGFAQVKWPARVEMVAHRPTVIVDAAHNTASIQSLLQTLAESFVAQRRLLVFATTQEKDVRGMLELLLPHFEAVILTRYLNNPRAVDVGSLEALAKELSPIPRFACPDPSTAWRQACQWATPQHLICVTGSFFLAAEMRQEISKRPFVLAQSD